MLPDIITDKHLLMKKSRKYTDIELCTEAYMPTLMLLRNKIKELKKNKQHTVGLSAMQLGVYESVFIIKKRFGWMECINPYIIVLIGDMLNCESCLSFPGKWYNVHRAERIVFMWYDRYGKSHHKTFTGKICRRIQHEYDHINGIVPSKKQFID